MISLFSLFGETIESIELYGCEDLSHSFLDDEKLHMITLGLQQIKPNLAKFKLKRLNLSDNWGLYKD